jgi:hypothetical protein
MTTAKRPKAKVTCNFSRDNPAQRRWGGWSPPPSGA